MKTNPLAAWDLVCRPKEKGGLGVLNITIQNQGLLLKHLHNFYNKADVPWVDLIWTSYYTVEVPHVVGDCGSFWWRDVFQLAAIYRGVTSVEVGSGGSVLFWKD